MPHADSINTTSDYSKGFGGRYGVESDKVDKAAVGFDYKSQTEKHDSQKGEPRQPGELGKWSEVGDLGEQEKLGELGGLGVLEEVGEPAEVGEQAVSGLELETVPTGTMGHCAGL